MILLVQSHVNDVKVFSLVALFKLGSGKIRGVFLRYANKDCTVYNGKSHGWMLWLL